MEVVKLQRFFLNKPNCKFLLFSFTCKTDNPSLKLHRANLCFLVQMNRKTLLVLFLACLLALEEASSHCYRRRFYYRRRCYFRRRFYYRRRCFIHRRRVYRRYVMCHAKRCLPQFQEAIKPASFMSFNFSDTPHPCYFESQ